MGTELVGNALSRGTNQLGTHCWGPNVRGPYVFGTKCVTALFEYSHGIAIIISHHQLSVGVSSHHPSTTYIIHCQQLSPTISQNNPSDSFQRVVKQMSRAIRKSPCSETKVMLPQKSDGQIAMQILLTHSTAFETEIIFSLVVYIQSSPISRR